MGTKIKLGSMQQITDLRSVWANEAHDFTPWLAENIDLLNEATGLSLEVVEQESQVGSFSLDILAQDPETEAFAVIENQLEDTNHDHLGKLLTYAAGKRARYIIWVVKEAREEHRAAIEWLNSYTVDGVGFFLVEVQLWSIDGSVPAPKLSVVEQPNDWAKIIKQPTNTQSGAAEQFKYEYWTEFNDYAFLDSDFSAAFKKHKPSSDHWYTLNIGTSAVHIALLVNTRDQKESVEFYISDSKDLFDKLFSHREEIEKIVGTELDWRRLDEKKASRVLLEKETDLKDSALHAEQFDWFMTYSQRFKKAFTRFL